MVENNEDKTNVGGTPPENGNGGEGAPDAGSESISFTKEQQAVIDKIISDRLKRQELQYQKERDTEAAKRAEAERISKLEGEEKLKAEYEAKMREANEKYATIERELRTTEARSELVASGLNPALADRVVGATLEETKANVLALKHDVEAMAKSMVNQSAAKGSPPAPQGGEGMTELDKIRATLKKATGLK